MMNGREALRHFHSSLLNYLNLKRVLVALFLFNLSSCSETCRQWNLEEYSARYPCLESSQITLEGSNTCTPLNLVIVRTSSGVRMYIDLLQVPVRPTPNDLTKAFVKISYKDDDSYQVLADRFEGGQRLLLPDEVSEQLIGLLIRDQSFCIAIDGYRSDVIPENFACSYDALLNH